MTSSIFDLTGKAVLVTGGNGGIGLGMADKMAEAGADICIWGRNKEKNLAAVEQLKAHGRRVTALECDITDEKQVKSCFEETVSALGKVDACFANAGIGVRGTKFHEISLDEWKAILTTNLDGVFFTFQEAVRHMLEHGRGGSLVATASLAALEGMARGQHYAAAKAGLLAMVRSLAVEYGRNGIRANAVIPGWIETDMTRDLFGWDKFQQKVLTRIPHGRWGTAEDFGAIAVYFAGDGSSYHSGDLVVIDGAYSIF